MTEDASRKAKIRQDFIDARGYWSRGWDPLLDLAPDYFAAYSKLSSVPWRTDLLPPKIKELLYIAIDVSITHMYEPGLRVHIRNALNTAPPAMKSWRYISLPRRSASMP